MKIAKIQDNVHQAAEERRINEPGSAPESKPSSRKKWLIWIFLVVGLFAAITMVFVFPSKMNGFLPASFFEPRTLNGSVLLIGSRGGSTPAVGAAVGLEGVGTPVRILTGGTFRLSLPDVYEAGDKITLLVILEGYRISHPVGGMTELPKELDRIPVDIQLLPLGSKEFLSDAHIEFLIETIAKQSTAQVRPAEEPAKADFGVYLRAWADRFGLSEEQVTAAVSKWTARTSQQDPTDFFKLGLAAFYDQNFAGARDFFIQSAGILEMQPESNEDALVRDYLLAGDAAYQEYRFEETLANYRRALNHNSKEDRPALWARVLIDVGNAQSAIGLRSEDYKHLSEAAESYRAVLEVYSREKQPRYWAIARNNLANAQQNLGFRTGGEAGARLLAEAIAIYRSALEPLTVEEVPQRWATTQTNLGISLQNLGNRTDGEAGVRILAEAAEAYRAALEVRTREKYPQEWSLTQNNLGNVLMNQGIRAAGTAGIRLLAEAVEAYRSTLEVRTREHRARDWALTQNNLANAYKALKDWPKVAAVYAELLQANPDDSRAYRSAACLYQNILYDFSAAFDLSRRWQSRHPEDLTVLSDFAERHFTTGRYPEARKRLTGLLSDPKFDPASRMRLQALEIATLVVMNEEQAVPQKLEKLRAWVAGQPDDFRRGWSFAGSKHFIETNLSEPANRDWLLALLTALEAKNRDAILTALDAVQAQYSIFKTQN